MKEFLRRLTIRPSTGFLLVLTTFLANILALATPLFVVQVLNKYLSAAVDSTLLTLIAGTLVAIVFELLLRDARFRLARRHSEYLGYNLCVGVGQVLSSSYPEDARKISEDDNLDPVDAVTRIQSAYSPYNLCGFLDLPFSLIFVAVIFLIEPRIGLIAAGGLVALSLGSWIILRVKRAHQRQAQSRLTGTARNLRQSIGGNIHIRPFLSLSSLQGLWHDLSIGQSNVTGTAGTRQSMLQATSLCLQGVMTVAVISYGAVLTLRGQLDVGALIGVNILAARALAPVARFANAADGISAAQDALKSIRKLLPFATRGAASHPILGSLDRIVLRDLSYRPPLIANPRFAGLTAELEPGGLTLVRTSYPAQAEELLNVLLGIRQPSNGQILINGVNLSQLPYEWWRRQVGYVPDRPVFSPDTLRFNFTAGRQGDDDAILRALERAGISKAVDAHPSGLDLMLSSDGDGLPLEFRWRLGLARALYADPPIILIEGGSTPLTQDSLALLRDLIANWAREGRLVALIGTPRDGLQPDRVIDIAENGTCREVERQPERDTQQKSIAAATFAAVEGFDETAAHAERQRRLVARAGRPARALSFMICAMVVALSVWAYFGRLDRVTTAEGEVIPSSKVQTVESLEGGIVADILVEEGTEVQRGQSILALETLASDADVQELRTRMAALQMASIRLDAEIARTDTFPIAETLEARFPRLAEKNRALLAARRAKLAHDTAAHEQVIANRKSKLVEITTQIGSLQRQRDILSEQVAISERLLSKDLTNRMLHLDVVSRHADIIAKLAAMQASKPAAQAAVKEAQSALELLHAVYEEEARSQQEVITRELEELRARMRKFVDSQRRRILRAPTPGLVKALSTFSVGAVIAPGEVVAEIVPMEVELLIEANLPPSSVGYIQIGQTARLRLSARDAFRYRPITGRVLQISPDTFKTPEGDVFYRIMLSADTDRFVTPSGEEFRLGPGVQVGATIVLGSRTILEYLADPILKWRGTAFQEK